MGAAAVGAPPQTPGRRPNYILAAMIQSSQLVWSTTRSNICLNPVWRVGCVRAHVASLNDPRVSVAKPRTAAPKFGDEAARPNRWLG